MLYDMRWGPYCSDARAKRMSLTSEERRKLAYVAGVVEDTAGALRGEIILDDDDSKLAADYLMQAAAFIRKHIGTE